ncbi:MAG: aspartyl protease family protein [Cyanobacteria bacterium REEB67]|nr:aspartyl protease family protein [Cyanobacteria bacterium REEB67]
MQEHISTKSRARLMQIGLIVVGLACSLAGSVSIGAQAKSAAPSMAMTAMTQFKAKQYPQAAESFRKAIAANRSDSNLYYYYALCLHYSGDVSGAKAIYNQIMQYFPNSEAAAHARTAIGAMAPACAAPGTSETPSAPAPISSRPASVNTENKAGLSLADMPDEARIYFRNEGGGMVIGAKFNNRPLDSIFDTGAEGIVVGKNHLRALGIPLPAGAPTGMVQGVGGVPQHSWRMPCTVTVGQMERRNVEVTVQEELDTPLIGQTFFQGMTYTIDNNAKSINFVKKTSRSGSIYNDPSKSTDSVPFVREGKEIIVQVRVNGKTIPMYFDTGASGIHLTTAHAKSIGLVVPDDAPLQKSVGIAGTSMCSLVTVKSIALGPIEKQNIEVAVDMESEMPHPLLGQSFFGDCHYSVDEAHHVIHLRR